MTMKAPYLPLVAATLALSLPVAAQTAGDRVKQAASDAGNALERAGEAIARGAREAWSKTKAYVSEDPDTYRAGARQKLEELRREMEQLRVRSADAAIKRPYLATHMHAMEQQHQFAMSQLQALPPEDIRHGREGARRSVDATLERLEEHLDVMQKEVRDVTGR